MLACRRVASSPTRASVSNIKGRQDIIFLDRYPTPLPNSSHQEGGHQEGRLVNIDDTFILEEF